MTFRVLLLVAGTAKSDKLFVFLAVLVGIVARVGKHGELSQRLNVMYELGRRISTPALTYLALVLCLFYDTARKAAPVFVVIELIHPIKADKLFYFNYCFHTHIRTKPPNYRGFCNGEESVRENRNKKVSPITEVNRFRTYIPVFRDMVFMREKHL